MVEITKISDHAGFKSKVQLPAPEAPLALPEMKLNREVSMIEALDSWMIVQEIKQRLFVLAFRNGKSWTRETVAQALDEI